MLCGWCDKPVYFTDIQMLKPSIFEGTISHVACIAEFLGAEEDVFDSIGMSREAFIQRQKELCITKGWPLFMPSSGYCWNCHEDFVSVEMRHGNDGTQLVTGCRICCRSYCD